ncbi:MAG: hypothetical protein SH820_17310 [Xanthomonadales bacterium]|nr:hypothetical protein [Xanthomonadales bacterium]
MNGKAKRVKPSEWALLFNPAEPNTTLALFPEPQKLIQHVDDLLRVLGSLINQERAELTPRVLLDGSWTYGQPEMIKAMELFRFLEQIKHEAECARPLSNAMSPLSECYSAFLEEGTSLSTGKLFSQSLSGGKPRRPKLPKRAVMMAMESKCCTTQEVENYLYNKLDLQDRWGLIGIVFEDGNFELSDFDHKTRDKEPQTAILTSDYIPKLMTAIRKAR